MQTCRKMDMAIDLNTRVIEAFRSDVPEEVWDAFDEEREEKIGGIDADGLQIALDAYLKTNLERRDDVPVYIGS